MKMKDIERAAKYSANPELRAACQYMIDNPSIFKMVERTGEKDGDGKMSRKDLRKALDRNGDKGDDKWLNGFDCPTGINVNNISEKDAAQIIRDNFELFDTADDPGGDRDGKISSGDVKKIAEDKGLPAHIRAAAEYMINNKSRWDYLESQYSFCGLRDDRLRKGDLDRYLKG